MRAVFLGKSKRSAVRALDWLAGRGVEVVAVVAPEPDPWTRPEQRLDLAAERHGLPLVADSVLYTAPPPDVDVVISFLFWKLVREPLLSLGRLGCLNFHPAPLPDFRGLGGYNVAILEGVDQWGVSCHFMDERFDTGDIVEVERFPIDAERETAFSLDLQSQARLVELFKRVMERVVAGALRHARGVRAAASRASRRRPRPQAAGLLVPATPRCRARGGRSPPHARRRGPAGGGRGGLPRRRPAAVAAAVRLAVAEM